MIETSWWDSCILRFRWTDQGWELRVGVFCLAFLTWLVVDLVRWLTRKDDTAQGPPTAGGSSAS